MLTKSCWSWMKRRITLLEALRSRAEIEKAWSQCWSELSQEQDQSWIERISRHIQTVIELEEENEYRERRAEELIRSYDAEKRRTRYLRAKRDSSKDENWVDIDWYWGEYHENEYEDDKEVEDICKKFESRTTRPSVCGVFSVHFSVGQNFVCHSSYTQKLKLLNWTLCRRYLERLKDNAENEN